MKPNHLLFPRSPDFSGIEFFSSRSPFPATKDKGCRVKSGFLSDLKPNLQAIASKVDIDHIDQRSNLFLSSDTHWWKYYRAKAGSGREWGEFQFRELSFYDVCLDILCKFGIEGKFGSIYSNPHISEIPAKFFRKTKQHLSPMFSHTTNPAVTLKFKDQRSKIKDHDTVPRSIAYRDRRPRKPKLRKFQDDSSMLKRDTDF